MSLVNTIQTQTLGIPGRSMSSAGKNHWLVDGAAHSGGPAEGPAPADMFLSGVSACAVLLIEKLAEADGLPLDRALCTITGVRDEADTSWFQSVSLAFELRGLDRPTSEDLVTRFTQKCPLYRTVAAATNVTWSVQESLAAVA